MHLTAMPYLCTICVSLAYIFQYIKLYIKVVMVYIQGKYFDVLYHQGS